MSDFNIIMRGNFNYYGTFDFTQDDNTGSVIFDGTTQSINNYNSGSGTFNNVIFSSSTSATLANEGITVAGDLTIEQGNFNSANYPVTVGGNWDNSGGSYTPGTSLVTFDSSGDHQDVSGTNTFYDVLQINNGYNLRFYGTPTINNMELNYFCWAYGTININGILNIDNPASKFNANGASANATIATLDQGGTIFCNGAATITINDLVETEITGTYYADDVGGVINLSNGGSTVDLQADLYIYGGTMNIAGSICWWPFGGDASITMTDGVIDVTDCGIYLSGSNTLTETITGGTIRTAYGFTGVRDDFKPSGGTIELYGSTNASLSMGTDSNFYDVLINKAASDNAIAKVIKPSKREKLSVDRDGNVIEHTRSETVTATSELDINGDFTIDNGIFDTNGFDLYVAGDWTNNVGNTGFVEGTGTVFFDGSTEGDILTEETFYNMIVDKTIGTFTALEMFQNVHVTNDLLITDGVLEMNSPSNLMVENNVTLESGAGLNANDASDLFIYVGGNWTNYNIDYSIYNGFWHGYVSTVIFNTGGDNIITTSAPQEDFYNLTVYKASDQFRTNDNIQVFGNLLLFDGEWNDNVGGLTHTFHGDFEITSNAAWYTHISPNTVVFAGENDQEFIHNHIGAGYFKDVIIDKSPVDIAMNNGLDQPATNVYREMTESRAQTVTMYTDMDLQISGTLTIEEGTLNVNGNTLRGYGDININSGGLLSMNSNSILWIKDGSELAVNGGGILEVMGTPGNLATVTQRSTGNYDFNVYQGGTISAEYGLFEYMTANGVYVRNGGFVDPSHSFDYCTFQNGYVGPGTLLYVENDQDLTITGANFPDNASTTYNVAKIMNHGSITLEGYTGIFAGEAYEYDNNDPELIHWSVGLIPIDDLAIQYNEGANTIVLTWSYSPPADQYKVYRSTDPYDFSGATVFTESSVGYSEPATGTQYFYRVTAENITENVGSTGKSNHLETAPWSK